MKPNPKQKTVLDLIIRQLISWQKSNDIASPTIQGDISEMSFAVTGASSPNLTETEAEEVDAAMEILLELVRGIENDATVSAVEPYFGWCDVKGCKNEASCGGIAWQDSGYWSTCSEHTNMHRAGFPQSTMKAASIEREARRDEKGFLYKFNT